jgi:hypothetical protein
MVIAAGLLYPSLKGMHGHYKLQGGVDAVRAAWAHARARAIEEGRPYRFAVEPNGSHFRVAPNHPDSWAGSSSGNGTQCGGLVLEQALPPGVHFSVGDPPATPTPEASEKEHPPSGEWTPVVVFLPDGTASEDSCVNFQVKGTRSIALHLRGLTGNVTARTVQH